MTLIKKSLTAAVATLAVAGAVTVSTSNEAEARWRHRHGGAIAAGIIGGLALGAIAASAAQPTYYAGGCYRVRKAVWSDFHGAYVVRRVTVCN